MCMYIFSTSFLQLATWTLAPANISFVIKRLACCNPKFKDLHFLVFISETHSWKEVCDRIHWLKWHYLGGTWNDPFFVLSLSWSFIVFGYYVSSLGYFLFSKKESMLIFKRTTSHRNKKITSDYSIIWPT